MADKIPSSMDEMIAALGEQTVYELASQQYNLLKRREDLPGKSPMTSARDEAARIQEIADKYRIATPKTKKRETVEEFLEWLYKEDCRVADEHDLISLRIMFEYYVPKFLEESE